MMTNVLTLTVQASNIGYPTCFVLDLGNGDGVLFGSLICGLNHRNGFKRIPSFTYPLVEYNYTYNVPGIYNITWNGQNDFNNATVYTIVPITERPCSTPKVALPNLAHSPLTHTGIFRSAEFIVRSRYQVDCERATGAILLWSIFKNETEKGFVLQTTKVTKTSNLIIQSKDLRYRTYCIKLTLSLINAYGISGTAEGYFKIVPSDLIVDIRGGSANKRMYSQPVLVNAAGSMDPDTSDQSGLEFNWFCYNVSNRDYNIAEQPLSAVQNVLLEDPLVNGCFGHNGSLVMNGSQIVLPGKEIIKNGVYLVNLVLRSGNRKASKATVIRMTDELISHFLIRLVMYFCNITLIKSRNFVSVELRF